MEMTGSTLVKRARKASLERGGSGLPVGVGSGSMSWGTPREATAQWTAAMTER